MSLRIYVLFLVDAHLQDLAHALSMCAVFSLGRNWMAMRAFLNPPIN